MRELTPLRKRRRMRRRKIQGLKISTTLIKRRPQFSDLPAFVQKQHTQ
jgi:hypothetical protein